LKGVFKPHTNLCIGVNDGLIYNEKAINNVWKPHLQDFLNTATILT